jgi:hypothetical protein
MPALPDESSCRGGAILDSEMLAFERMLTLLRQQEEL